MRVQAPSEASSSLPKPGAGCAGAQGAGRHPKPPRVGSGPESDGAGFGGDLAVRSSNPAGETGLPCQDLSLLR